MTECPVCSSKNVKPADLTCPDCQSDLSSLKLIEKIDTRIEGRSNMKPLLILILVFVVLGWAGMFWYVNTTLAKGNDNSVNSELTNSLNASFQKISTQNEQLKYQLNFLADKLDKINSPAKTANTGTDSIAKDTKPKAATQPRYSTDKTYIVKEGETVWDIAARFYGDGSYYRQIMSDNGIDSVDHVKPGMTLTIKKPK